MPIYEIRRKLRKKGRLRGVVVSTTALAMLSIQAYAQSAVDELTQSVLRREEWRGERHKDIGTHGQEDKERSSWRPFLGKEQVLWELEYGSYELGVFDAQRLLARYPNEIDEVKIAIQKGLALMGRGEFEQARTEFSLAYEQASNTDEDQEREEVGTALYYIALTGMTDGYQSAEKTNAILEEFLRRYPGHPYESGVLHLLGILAETEGNYTKALGYYRSELTKRIPEDQAHVDLAIARTLVLAGRYDEADRVLEERGARPAADIENAGSGHQDLVEEAWLRGEVYLNAGKYKDAEQAFIKVVESENIKSRRPGLLGLADTYRAVRLYDSSAALYDRIMLEDSNDIPGMAARYRKAIGLVAAGDTVNGTAELHEVAEDDRNLFSDLALLKEAERAYRNRDYRATLERANLAINKGRTVATRVRAFTLAAAANVALGDPQAAGDELKSATALAPGDGSETLMNLLRGIASVQSNQPAEAIRLLNLALEHMGDDTLADQALYWLGEAYYQASLYQAATQTMDRLIGRFPNSPYTADAIYTAGWSYLRLKQYERASETFRNLVKAFPLTGYAAEAHLRRGDALYLADKFGDAIDAYSESERANPSVELRAHAAYQKALAYMRLADPEQAMEVLENFIPCNPASELAGDILYLEGSAALQGKDPQRALSAMVQLLQRPLTDETAAAGYEIMARAYRELGESERAAAAYSIIQQRYPGTGLASGAAEESALLGAASGDERGDAGSTCGGYTKDALALGRGEIYLMVGRLADAVGEFHGADVAPGSECRGRALLGMARSAIAAGNVEAGRDTLAMIVDQYPTSDIIPMAILELGRLSERQGDSAKVRGDLGRLGSAGTRSREGLEARRGIAQLYLHAGYADSARTILYENTRSTITGGERDAAWIDLAAVERDSVRLDTLRGVLRDIGERNRALRIDAAIALAESFAADRRLTDAEGALAMINNPREHRGVRGMRIVRMGDINARIGLIEKAREWYRLAVDGCFGDDIRTTAVTRLDALSKL